MPKISIIAAIAKNGVIGKNNVMPWNVPQEMALFRQLTEGKPVIIGRRTFDGLPNALENRFLVVLTRKNRISPASNVQIASSIPDALEAANEEMSKRNTRSISGSAGINDDQHEIMVAGGENVYQQFLPLADRLYLSHMHDAYEGDAFFPRVSRKDWQPTATTHFDTFSFITYDRVYARENQAA